MSAPVAAACWASSTVSRTFVLAGQASTSAPGLMAPNLLDRHLQQSLAFRRRQRPALADQSAHPDPVVVQGSDAVGHERTQRLLVDLLAPGTAEGV